MPVSSVGKRFRFKVRVVTNFAVVESAVSASMILADKPDKPSMAPTRNSLTSNTTLAANILAVPGDHGSSITSYNIEVDDGLGGPFIELQGQTFASLALTGTLTTGVKAGVYYRIRYRAINEIGAGEFSEIAYI